MAADSTPHPHSRRLVISRVQLALRVPDLTASITFYTKLFGTTLLDGISGRTLRACIWRGLFDDQAAGRTLADHEAIFDALSTRDGALSQAAALMHVSQTERWLRGHLRNTHPLQDVLTATGKHG